MNLQGNDRRTQNSKMDFLVQYYWCDVWSKAFDYRKALNNLTTVRRLSVMYVKEVDREI